MKTSDRIGQKFTRLTLIEVLARDGRKAPRGVFRCDCGATKTAQINVVVSGHTKSCGCLAKEYYASGTVRSHGERNTPEYRTWSRMKSRCLDPNNPSYSRYGGRGIKVCDEWLESYVSFASAMGPRPSSGHSIDRIDVDGHYEPTNCRWADRFEQQSNRSIARLLTYGGETMTMLQWATRLGMSWTSLANRAKRGLTDEEIIATPRRKYPR